MKKILLLLFLTNMHFVNAQKRQDLSTVLFESDSIQITSHKNLFIASQIPGKDNSYYKKVVENGFPNQDIIIEKITLDKKSSQKLVHLLTNQTGADSYDDLQCFIPHHSIFIFKNGKCLYLDICFGCKHFSASKEINIPEEFLLAIEDWEKLKSFFGEQNIKYEMPEKKKE
jgi:hypothetical protein